MWLAGVIFFAVLGYCVGIALTANRPAAAHKRGAIVEESRVRPRREELTLAGVGIPPEDETKHFKLIGTTGTGKSTAIRELLTGVLARGDRVIIAGPAISTASTTPGAGAVVLNPFDARSKRWDLFAEVQKSYDVGQLARPLIPDHDGADKTWRSYAGPFSRLSSGSSGNVVPRTSNTEASQNLPSDQHGRDRGT